MSSTAIEIQSLHKNYGKVQALKGVSLKVEHGIIFGFLGPNGAGKTTTIRCMLDAIRPQQGSIRMFGLDPQQDAVAVRSRVGYLPGELNLESNQKVADARRYFGALRGNNLDWRYVEELARRLDLDLQMSIKNLSKGNKQKVGVVQALMHRPDLLILDEPTSGCSRRSTGCCARPARMAPRCSSLRTLLLRWKQLPTGWRSSGTG